MVLVSSIPEAVAPSNESYWLKAWAPSSSVWAGLPVQPRLMRSAVVAYCRGSGALSGLGTGSVVGACFVATSYGINYQFANRSVAALLIDGGYHVLQFAAFGLVLGAWPW